MAPHSSTLTWKIPWTEETGRLQSMGLLRVGHDWATSLHFSLSCVGEGNGNSLQCSCLENPRDRGAWWAAVYGVAQSWTRLKRLNSSSSSSSIDIFYKFWPFKWKINKVIFLIGTDLTANGPKKQTNKNKWIPAYKWEVFCVFTYTCKIPYYHDTHFRGCKKWRRECSYTHRFFLLIEEDTRHTHKAYGGKYEKSSNTMLPVFSKEKDHFHLGIWRNPIKEVMWQLEIYLIILYGNEKHS